MHHKHLVAGLALLWAATVASAHTFGAPYTLPVPFWMYAYGASAALVLSFVVVGLFAGVPLAPMAAGTSRGGTTFPRTFAALRVAAVALLGLCIATGLLGTRNPFANFNMTFFWIVFVLGFAYGTALWGDVYRVVNPWRTLCEGLQRLWPAALRPVFAQYPAALGCYPALLLFMVFIWLELFGHTAPFSLSVVLLVYTVINLAGAKLWGVGAWFENGEFFSVFLRLIALGAPLAIQVPASGPATVGVRRPFAGLLETPAQHFSVVVFVLFMLSATAYDGMHESGPWSRVFWGSMYPLIQPLVSASSSQPYVVAAKIFHYWQSLALFLSPLVYLAFYLAALKLTQIFTGSAQSLRSLAVAFAHSLVPIALVYHVSHYYTLLLSQGLQIVRLVSDPFGWGWNVFGTAKLSVEPLLPDPSAVWHTQVGLILAGHVVSVYLAHQVALQLFGNNRRAALSQLPMLLLMVGLTAAGLWILSLPIASTTPVLPAAGS